MNAEGLTMTEYVPGFPDQRKADADHLKLLSIFHFVGAGMALLGVLFLVAHYLMFRGFLANPNMWVNQNQMPPPAEFLTMLKWFYLVMGFWFIASGVLNVLSGLYIRARKHRTFSIVVAGITCLHMPLGTVLGIFTIVVLIRSSVRELYDAPMK